MNPDFPGQGSTGIVSTDDEGATWNESIRIYSPDPDKPSIGSGPYHDPRPAWATYPSAVYFCIGDGFHFPSANEYCYRSDDGGSTWGSATVASTGKDLCYPFVGELTIAEDGTVYLPFAHCGHSQGMAVSTDNGETWEVLTVPGMVSDDKTLDQFPDIATDDSGRVYFAASSRGRPLVSMSEDNGKHWTAPVDVGLAEGIAYAQFPSIIAGDAGRAAFAFLGSTTSGYPENANYTGAWHLYVAVTLDGGVSWETTDVTSEDPVQRGCIGSKFTGSCKRRNLLDFIDMAIDAEGRILIAYTDGCVSVICVGPDGTPADSNESSYAVARQVNGPRMFAAFDKTGR
jgi:hypothetical protein